MQDNRRPLHIIVDGVKVPNRPKDRLTAEQVRNCLDYDPLTGKFRWRVTRGCRYRGSPAGTKSHDRYTIQVEGCRQETSVLAWLHYYGEWPKGEIDHINLDKGDDRIENLRDATISQNEMNKGIRKDNTSGFKGVAFDSRSGKYIAKINVRGEKYPLGYFREAEHAGAAYRIAASVIHGEFARFSHE